MRVYNFNNTAVQPQLKRHKPNINGSIDPTLKCDANYIQRTTQNASLYRLTILPVYN